MEEKIQCLESDESSLTASLTSVPELLGQGTPPPPCLFQNIWNVSNGTYIGGV